MTNYFLKYKQFELGDDMRDDIWDYLTERYPLKISHATMEFTYEMMAVVDKKYKLNLFRGFSN